jgi:hypothetical protein
MTLHGHIHDGKIVLDAHPGPLPEGAAVQVQVIPPQPSHAEQQPTSFYDAIKDLIGSVEGLPPDLSVNLDHYLYGAPKRQ